MTLTLTPELVVTGIIRLANAILWTIVVVRILHQDRPTIRLVRQLLMFVVLAGMWVLAFGTLASIGVIPTALARWVVTMYTALTAIIALAIVRGASDDAMADRRYGFDRPAAFRDRPAMARKKPYGGSGDH